MAGSYAIGGATTRFNVVWLIFPDTLAPDREPWPEWRACRKRKAPPVFSFQRPGYGLEMIGALGNTDQFGFDWQRQQQYVGAVFSYSVSKNWTLHVEPAFGLSDVSDPFVLRMGAGYSIDHVLHRR